MAVSAPPTVRSYRRSGDPVGTAAAADCGMLSPVADVSADKPTRRWRTEWGLALGLVVLLVGALAVSAAAQPGPPTPPDPCVGPAPRPVTCAPALPTMPPAPTTSLPEACKRNPLPYCFPSTTPGQPTATTTPNPCATIPPGQPRPPDCIPQPTTSAPAPTGPQQPGQPGDQPSDECGITDIGACITEAIDAFFRGIVTAALNPLLDLLSKTLLTTPTPDSLPRIGELWSQSWDILLASYAILILIAGVLVMSYESVQTRHSIKEIAPRIAVGFLAGALSLFLASKAIDIANALAQGVMGGGVDANSAAGTLKNMIMNSLNGGIFIIFIGIFLAGMLIALLVTYVVRVALTVILVVGAPIALMFHALPQTDGIARFWWKAFGGCLAIQVVQSLTLITAMRVFLAPGGFTLFGPTMSGLVNLLVSLALMYILFKIPFWILGSLRNGGGRSFVASLARAHVMGKAMGLLGGRGWGRASRAAPRRTSSSAGPTASTSPTHTQRARSRRTTSTGRTPTSQPHRGPRTQRQTHPSTRHQPRSGGQQPPKFQQPTPQMPTHYLATGTTPGKPAMPQFHSTTRPPTTQASTPPRPPSSPGAPQFQAPHTPRRTSPTRGRTAAIPPHLRFQPATPTTPAHPTHVDGPPPPPPTFQPSTPNTGTTGVRARTHTPAPMRFQSPPPRPPAPCVSCGVVLSGGRCANPRCAASPAFRGRGGQS